MAEQFWHAFIPLFVALDSIGLVPLFWGLAERLSLRQRRQAMSEAVLLVSSWSAERSSA